VIPKKDGKMRPILDCRRLNACLNVQRFRMESITTVRELLRPGDWMVKLDIRKAYWHLPMATSAKPFLRFWFEDKHFQYRTMPFGLNCAPRSFTKFLKPVVAKMRAQGVRIVQYLDDMLIMASSGEECVHHLRVLVGLLSRLGISINVEKSILQPCQELEYLGWEINTNQMRIRVPGAKLKDLRRDARRTRMQLEVTLRQLARLLGRIQSVAIAVFPTRLRCRELLRIKNGAWARTRNWEFSVVLSEEAKQELLWWETQLGNWNGVALPLSDHLPQLRIQSDASEQGWGAICLETGQRIHGFWHPSERRHSNNWRELHAAIFAAKSFLFHLPTATSNQAQLRSVLLQSDNQVTVSYLNKQGGRHDFLSRAAEHFLKQGMERGWRIRAEYLPGVENTIADQLSRRRWDIHDWTLDRGVFTDLVHRWGHPTVDLFASRHNHRLRRWVSWHPQPGAWATDAFSLNWNKFGLIYANPPFRLLLRVLRKAYQERATMILVTPVWKGAPWWPLVKRMAVDQVLLPDLPHLFIPGGRGAMGRPAWRAAAFLLRP